jgi:hypothetical protein
MDSMKYVIVDGRIEEIRTLVVHSFTMGDVEDPDIYAAQPMIDWEKSEQGQWVMANAVETPSWHRMADPVGFGYKYQIRAKLQGPSLTFFLLKWGEHS